MSEVVLPVRAWLLSLGFGGVAILVFLCYAQVSFLWKAAGFMRFKKVLQEAVKDRSTSVILRDQALAKTPRWHAGRLYFSEAVACEIRAVDPANRVSETLARVPDMEEDMHGPGGLGWTPDGVLLVAQMRARRLLRLGAAGELQKVASLKSPADVHCNDMTVASDGSAFLGDCSFDARSLEDRLYYSAARKLRRSRLWRVDTDGEVSQATTEELSFPSGMAITPDGRELLVAETYGDRISSYPIRNGSLGRRSTWATAPLLRPHGLCLDAAGALWISSLSQKAFVRMARGGQVLEVVPATEGFTAVAVILGGAEWRTLFMLEAREAGSKAKELGPGNSQIIAAEVDVPAARMEGCARYCAGYC